MPGIYSGQNKIMNVKMFSKVRKPQGRLLLLAKMEKQGPDLPSCLKQSKYSAKHMKPTVSRHWASSNKRQWYLRDEEENMWALQLPQRQPRESIQATEQGGGTEAEHGVLAESRRQGWVWVQGDQGSSSSQTENQREESRTDRKP